MIRKFLGLALVAAVLGGCGTVYTYNGQKYDSKEKFQRAVDDTTSAALATIAPLPAPITQRKLLFALPGEAALFTENVTRFVAVNGREPNSQQNEMFQELSKSALKNNKVFYDAIQKRGIYSSTQFIEMQAMSGSFAAAADTDTLYLVEPAAGSAQWYYTSFKRGKQIFAADRSDPTPAGKIKAFVEAVQAQAIQD